MPGSMIGNTMRHTIAQRDAPSMVAASSRLRGTVAR